MLTRMSQPGARAEGPYTRTHRRRPAGPADEDQFAPSTAPFMINYRVADLSAVLAALREEGCNVLDRADDSAYGKFGWVIDPEGNKVELREPPPGQ
jgi:predicted enzyme related to lactoylglutathione lyase